MSPNAEVGGVAGLSQCVQLYTGAQIDFGDLTPYLTEGFNKPYFSMNWAFCDVETSINHVTAPREHCTQQSSILKRRGGNGTGRMACLREKEEAALQEPGPDPVPEGGEPGQQAVLQARRQDAAVVARESAPALCRGAAKNFIFHF
jgi:hypothetical protein